MQIEEYFEFLQPDDIRLKGHRIGIESVLYEYVYRAQTAEEIAARFPTLSLEQVYATILYYLQNTDRLRAYLAAWIEHGERARAAQAEQPTPAILHLREAKAERSRQLAEKSTSPYTAK
jgi:uncharacterized protein (DUF433 family)